ncbi:MAG: pitrilysin family protein [Elusimicrobiota bacterium]
MTRALSLLVSVSLIAASAAAQTATEDDRSKPAPRGTAPAPAALTAVRDSLTNGLALALVESHRLPLVAVTLVIPQAGADPIGKEGLADFVAAMMQEGVPGLPDAAALADAIDDLGAKISVSATQSGMTIAVVALKEHINKALDLVSRMVREPNSLRADDAASANALERLRQQALAGLRMETPKTLASKRLSSDLFGVGPHGRFPTEASLASITPVEVAARHRASMVPNGSVLAVAGDVTLAELKTLAENNFGAWTSAGLPAAPAVPTLSPSASPSEGTTHTDLEIIVIDVPGDQAVMMLGMKVLERRHPDYDALALAIGVLGGPMIGRLDQNLRETHNWAYGARASLSAFADAGAVTMQTKVQVNRTGDALREILGEVARLGAELVPDPELGAAKNLLKGAHLRNTRTVESLAARLASIETLGLPPNTLGDYALHMDALSAQQVQAAARSWLGRGRVRVVVAGPADVVVPQLQGQGVVRVFDTEGRAKSLGEG